MNNNVSHQPRFSFKHGFKLALAAAAVVLAGCATPAGAPPPRDVSTVSDQSEGERRARLRLELAGAYFTRGQTATALDEVKVALVAWPEFTEAYNLRGLIYASMGETSLATESFKRALQIRPGDADTLHNYAWFLCRERRFGEAETMFLQALAQPQYRDTTRTLLARGVCQARDGRWGEAEQTLIRAYELDPANPATAVNLTEVLVRRGQYERARFYIRRVNDVPDQVNAQTLWLAARIEHKLGQGERARELGSMLSQRFPQSPEAMLFERGQFDGQ